MGNAASKRKTKAHTAVEKQSPTANQSQRFDGRDYHIEENSGYLLPNDDQEIDRLHEEHFVTKELLGCNIMAAGLKNLDFQAGGLSILDVCCGPATWLCETSLEYPDCHFSGVDMCSLWPQIIRPVNLSFTKANVLYGLPYPDKSFDFVQMRFVVLAFRTDEWPRVLSEIRRVLKDGGLFQCIDLDMRVTTDAAGSSTNERQDALRLGQLISQVESFCTSKRLDPTAGAKLDMWLGDAGMNILQSEYREIPIGWGGPIGEAYLHIFRGVLDGLAPWMKRDLKITDEEYAHRMNQTAEYVVASKAFIGLYAFLTQKPIDD
ncbi:hypothetical protein DFQ28_005340 [Apophysomyces sp. BC1034]|nr:hypothetical protein DFQ30_005174 [Apophysomyces sp. BC1015]KAG0177871.1 hypothetical protein DFQ29_004239 [Apophysomyces sp. BC1021]KAG0188139.1 hypothetical protein DFQ28_005340 [Apophysomyces sp. BC1034]